MDLKTNREADGRWYSKIFIGDSIDVNNVLSWTNLVLTDTSRKIDFEVHIAALNGNISSDTTNHTINLKIDKAPNKAPVFFEEPDEVIFVDLNKLGNSTVFRKLMPEIYDQNIWDILRVEIFLEDQALKPLASFDFETRIFTINGVSDALIGEYEMIINILDEFEAQTMYEFLIKIERPVAFQGFIIQEEEEEEIEEAVEAEALIEKSNVPIQAKIESIDQIGNMVVKFSSTMDTTFVNLKAIEESIEIDLSPYFIDDDFDQALLHFDWEI